MTSHDPSWLVMIHHDSWWSLMTSHNPSWLVMIHHDYSWFIMTIHDSSWSIKIHHDHEKMSNLYMGTTKVKFHPFSMIVPPKWPEFHGEARYTIPMSRNEHPIWLFAQNGKMFSSNWSNGIKIKVWGGESIDLDEIYRSPYLPSLKSITQTSREPK